MRPLVVIPARGGSKGIPKKNIKKLGDKPLIQYTIEAAREVFTDDIICVSTDNIEIKQLVEKIGLKVPFIRPAHLATDEAGTYDVLIHAVEFYENNGYFPDVVILLQVTSPFRTSTHIKEAFELFKKCYGCEMVVSVRETKSNPYFSLREEDKNGWLIKSKDGNYVRRQDCPTVWELNGAIYIINTLELKKKSLTKFRKVKKYLMDEKSSIDIDTYIDWNLAESIL